MSFLFRKRIKIFPGIYLNISKSGVSTTIGPRGANINIGKKGVFLNTGIPGTGIYSREKLDIGGNNSKIPIHNESPILPKPNVGNINNVNNDIITSEGLKGLKESLEDSKLERTYLSLDINSTISRLKHLKSNVEKIQNSFFDNLFTRKSTYDNLQKEIDDVSNHLEELKNQFEDCRADINILFDNQIEEQYDLLSNSFRKLLECNKIWSIITEAQNNELKSYAKTTVSRELISIKSENIDFVKSEHLAFHFQNEKGIQLFIYPAFIIVVDKSGELDLIDLKEINFTFKLQRFIEPKESIPSDTKIIDSSWIKVNKDGSPDLRYKDNYQTPVVHYGSINFKSLTGLDETFYFSNPELAQNFANEFLAYVSMLRGDVNKSELNFIPNITKKCFESVKEFGDKFISFINKINNDNQFIKFINQSPLIKNLQNVSPERLILTFLLIDLLKCFKLTKNVIDIKSKESFALLYLTARNSGLNIDNYSNLSQLYDQNLLTDFQSVFNSLKTELESSASNNSNFNLSILLRDYNPEMEEEYLTNLYRFASIIVKADNTVTADEEEALKKIFNNLDQKRQVSNINEPKVVEKVKISLQPNEENIDQVIDELNSMIGLNTVKQEVVSLINFIKVQKAREGSGLKTSSLSYHIVFLGNPGTGKTTVARIIAKIYKNLGVIKQGQLVETDRSGLVAEYLGQTAIKVNKIVDSALDGILFIDEAYSLISENSDSYGKEAVATLIKRMEDDRDRLVVILAGYTNEMKEFINRNPGLTSRFNRYIEFPDYNPDELLAIFNLKCKKLEYNLTEEATQKLNRYFVNVFSNRDKTFGNGRLVRNLFEKSLVNQANRIAIIPSLTKEILTTISVEDIP